MLRDIERMSDPSFYRIQKPRILFVVSECSPYIKTGGLADAVRGLALSLRNLGVDVQIMLPRYSQFDTKALQCRQIVKIPSLPGLGHIQVANYVDRELNLPLWLVECPTVYDFECGIYEPSNAHLMEQLAQRFAVLGWSASQLAIHGGRWKPDVVHIHDWHASLASVYLDRYKQPSPKTILTIHNLAFQGCFSTKALRYLDIEHLELAPSRQLGQDTISFLAEAISRCDRITTVSPNYAKEIMQPDFGCGLDTLLRLREKDTVGIMNGVDYQIWCPELDPHLPMRGLKFDADARARCRYRLQSTMGLKLTERTPVLAFTNRITEQKMADRILEALPTLMERDVQIVIHGQGEQRFEDAFTQLTEKYPDHLAVSIGHRQDLEHLIHAGSDICLSPSRFEPCGLNPLYAIRYGAVPIVRAVGGLVDSIVDVNDITIAKGTANGFMFEGDEASDLIDAIDRALYYFDNPNSWQRIISNCTRMQFKWQRAAETYMDVYQSLLGSEILPGKSDGIVDDGALQDIA